MEEDRCDWWSPLRRPHPRQAHRRLNGQPPIKPSVRNQGTAHHQQVRVIGNCFGYHSGDMIRAPGADDGLDGQARHHFHPHGLQIGLQLRASVGVADQHCPFAGHDPVSMDQPQHRGREHDARQIVVGKEKLGLDKRRWRPLRCRHAGAAASPHWAGYDRFALRPADCLHTGQNNCSSERL